VARHVTGIKALVDAVGETKPDRAIVLENVPSYQDLATQGVGAFLNSPK
jgi:hypothetical protein